MNASKSTLVMLATICLGALGGCVAQAGTTEDPSSSAEQDLSAPNAVETTSAQQQRDPSRTGTKQVVKGDKAPAKVSGAELTGPVDPGGTQSQDEGDGQEPVPHPWVPRSTMQHR